jgi:hypothetical protein
MTMFILFESVNDPAVTTPIRVVGGCGDGIAGSVGQGVARAP